MRCRIWPSLSGREAQGFLRGQVFGNGGTITDLANALFDAIAGMSESDCNGIRFFHMDPLYFLVDELDEYVRMELDGVEATLIEKC